MPEFVLPELPPKVDLETKAVLKQAAQSYRYLAELKGIARTIPNQGILLSTLPLLEAKDSSAIENIITTHDDLYKEDLFEDLIRSPAAKEVQNYAAAVRIGYERVKQSGLLSNVQILEIQSIIERNRAGFRRLPGTALVNDRTGETIYTPPQHHDDIQRLMGNLEKVINDPDFYPVDPLIRMAVIHYQFESIHPFYDDNGRTGRILNILFLVLNGLLEIPVLYLSRYIIRTKETYYRLLQAVRDRDAWEEWTLYMLKGLEVTAKDTIAIIEGIGEFMTKYRTDIRLRHEKIYSQDLLNVLFLHPYTKIEFLEKELNITRQTASRYLEELSRDGFLKKEKLGRSNFYINEPLFRLFLDHQA